MKRSIFLVLLMATAILGSGCSEPAVNVEPFAPMMRTLVEMQMALTASVLQVTKNVETNQTAGGDINDPWIGRIAVVLAIVAVSIISTLVIYMGGVRPARKWIVNKIKNGG